MKKVILGAILGILLVNPCFAQETEKSEDRIIAIIGEDKIYFSEVEKISQSLNRFLKENFDKSKSWRTDYVNQYIARRALTKRAQREGLDKDEEVLAAMEQVKQSILSERIIGNMLTKKELTEEGLRAYYEQYKDRYMTPEQVKVSYVKFETQEKAQKIVEKLNQGKSFKKSVGRNNVDVEGWVSKQGMPVSPMGELKPEELEQIVNLGVGGSSQIMEINGEFYIFHVTEKEMAKELPFDEVRKQVEFAYTKQMREEAVNSFIMQTFEQEGVKIYTENIVVDMK